MEENIRVLGLKTVKLRFYNLPRSLQNIVVACAILLLACISKGFSQSYIYQQKHLNIFSNTFNREVNCIATDNHGFIWVGTAFGLFRFDGYNTDPVVYYNQDSARFSPDIHDIQYLNKHIYLATNYGVYVVETGNQTYQSHRLFHSENETIFNLLADNESGLWWLSHNGTLRNYFQKKIKSVALPFTISAHIPMICLGNTIWTTKGNSQLIGIDKMSGKIVFNTTFNEFNLINSINISKQNTLYLSTEKGLYEFNFNVGDPFKLSYHKEYGDSIRNIMIQDDVCVMSQMNSNITHLENKNGIWQKNIINNNNDNNFYTNRMMWYNNQLIIPSRTGLGVIQINKNNFNTILPINNNINGDSRGISEDADYIYLLTYNNIIRYHKKNKTSEIISNQRLISHGCYHENNTLWIASESLGLIKFDTKSYKTEFLFKNLPSKFQALVCVTPLNNDTLILGGFKHMFFYNKKNGTCTEITPCNKLKQPITQGHLRQIDTVNRNTLIVATRDGLYKINLRGELIKEYGNPKDSSIIRNMNCFWINKRKQIWAGTSDGIVIYDSSGKQLTKINYYNGLSGNKIAGMLNDEKGNLWVGTYSGLSKIQPPI
ncbi:MAG: hypothetical protein FGM54_03685 [Chitinophagaceae bacterium]|nr:hypothetical protein [Chitinophagaceae bacterium]